MRISKDTAARIAYAYQEIEVAQNLLKIVEEARQRNAVPDFRDGFGRVRGLQLGVPSGETGHRLLDVNHELAEIIIKAHIADKQAKIDALCVVARQELGGDAS